MPKILVIDDRQDNLLAIGALLEHLIPGCSVLTATSGPDGIALAQQEMPDTILLDVQMPVMNGYETCHKLKTDAKTKDIPIIMVTAIETDTQSRIKGLETGADAFVAKPIDEQELAAQVNAMLRIKESHGHLEAQKEDLEERELERTKALRDSEEKLRLLFEGTHDLISLTDTNAQAIWANPAWKRIFGSDLTKQPPHFTLVHPQDVDGVKKAWQDMLAKQGEIVNLEYRVKAFRGKYKTLETTVHQVNIGGQNLYYMIAHDISERKHAEEALKRSEERYRSLLEVMSSVVWSTDAEGKVISPQKSWEKYTGMKWRDYRSWGWFDAFREEERDEIKKRWSQALDERSLFVTHGKAWCREAEEYHFVFARAVPILAADGSIREWVGTMADIHDRMKAEKTLLESEERYRTITENSPDIILRFDSQLKHVYVSPSIKALSGREPEEYIGKTHRQIGYPDLTSKQLEGAIKKTFETGEQQELEYEYESSRQTMFVSLRLKPEFGENGLVESVIGVSRDITERRRLEDQLRQAQKMEAIGTLAGGIAHDFNNILGIIVGYSELSLEEAQKNTIVYENLDQILAAANRAGELVRQILAFSRKSEKQKKPVYVSQITGEVLKMIRSTIPTTIDIKSDVPEKTGLILANPTQIHQVIMNLCTNAGHAMRDKGGVLEITLKHINLDGSATGSSAGNAIARELKPGKYLEIKVTDTGHGMNQDVIERIFEPYFTTKKPGEGTGMGLSVVHGIIKSHGGEIDVVSEPDKGTSFTIYLPLTKYSAAAMAETKPKETGGGGGEHILFVDDEKDLVDMGKQMLEKIGYTVTVRTSSVEVLETFKENPGKYDLVITDQTMPNMTGIQLTRELIKIRPDVPIILCTGYSESVSKENYRAMGIRSFLMKPIVKKEMARIIREVLSEPPKSQSRQ